MHDLPFELSVGMEDFDSWLELSDYEKEEELNNYLSDTYGFCVNSYFWSEHGDVIAITEIDWDTEE